jgi:hypothetical protein
VVCGIILASVSDKEDILEYYSYDSNSDEQDGSAGEQSRIKHFSYHQDFVGPVQAAFRHPKPHHTL